MPSTIGNGERKGGLSDLLQVTVTQESWKYTTFGNLGTFMSVPAEFILLVPGTDDLIHQQNGWKKGAKS